MAAYVDKPRKPTIGITMGDPAGIGPEVIVKALAASEIRSLAKFVIYGQNELLNVAADRARIDPYWYRVGQRSARAKRAITSPVVVLDYDDLDTLSQVSPQPSKAGGLSSKQFVEDAIAHATLDSDHPRKLDAIVTAPISKESWRMAKYKWPGHTELFAHRTKTKRHTMMFVSPRLIVALATTHIPLMDIRNVLTIGKVFDPIDLGHQACKQLGIVSPTIAVTGLNPHAGEHGLFGDEEERLIEPAIDVARESGIDVHGPFPADTVFINGAAGKYDLVVAMYHDQGLIPVKLLGWDKAVNMTVGLPFVRTSPDHGTAFNIARKNKASEGSMTAAIELAARVAMGAGQGAESEKQTSTKS